MKLVARRTGVAISMLLVMTGCGGSAAISVGQAGGAAGRGALNVPSTDGAVAAAESTNAACDHYFAAQYLRCGGPRLPADELARIQARFELVCAHEIALPGSGVGAATLEECAAALDQSPCEFPDGPPAPCNFRGALSSGAACTDGLQCASGACNDNVLFSPEGPTGPRTCGTCVVAVATGQVCAHADFSASCSAAAAICLTSDTTAGLPTYTCTAVGQGDVGATCDDLAAQCRIGLYCSAQMGQCARLGAAGAPCGEGAKPPGDPGGCTAPLACVGLPGAATCGSGAAGAFCLGDSDCNAGLGCVPAGPCASEGQVARFGCSASGQCTAITWAKPGEACSDAIRCLVGSCNLGGGFAPREQDANGGLVVGKCPVIVADGAPCNVGTTCDTFSECFAGKCASLDSVVCK